MKSNHLYKKSERTRWFVTNPPVLKFPSRPNSSRSAGIFCPHPRRRRGTSSTFRIRKFQSAEAVRFELTNPCGLHAFQACALGHYATPPLYTRMPRRILTLSSIGGCVTPRLRSGQDSLQYVIFVFHVIRVFVLQLVGVS